MMCFRQNISKVRPQRLRLKDVVHGVYADVRFDDEDRAELARGMSTAAGMV